MHSWLEYLAFLSWQNQILCIKDFKKVLYNQEKIFSIHQLSQYIAHPETRQYIRDEKKWWKRAQIDKHQCIEKGINVTWPFHTDYPKSLLNMEKPPFLISFKGLPS